MTASRRNWEATLYLINGNMTKLSDAAGLFGKKDGEEESMKTKKFWNWRKVKNRGAGRTERILFLNGTIAEESYWFDDDVTPQLFAGMS